MHDPCYISIKLITLCYLISSTSCKFYFWGLDNENSKCMDGLIVGGQPVKTETVPYQAALQYRDYYFCCACIVSPKFLVSAAHCLWYFTKQPKGLTVRVGTDRTHVGGQVVMVARVIQHPKFSPRSADYDVSVAEMATALKFTGTIKPIKIAKNEPFEGEAVRVSGWGYLTERGPPSNILQSVVVKVVSRNSCEKAYKKDIKITKRMICAAVEGKDACFGDSGAPLISEDGLVGIVSMGRGCARINFPGIYTSVGNPEINEFIIEKTRQ